MEAHEYSERVLQDLLAADFVFPDQFWADRGESGHGSGERALMWAVLADGIECYRRNAHRTSLQARVDFAEAESWVQSCDWDCPFSFVNLCEAFGFDPAALRGALRRFKLAQPRGAMRRQRFRPVTLHAA